VFFFHWFTSGAGPAHTTDFDILVQQLFSSSSDSVGIDVQKLGQLGIAAAPQPEGFQSRI
jgi:hypothetical protein